MGTTVNMGGDRLGSGAKMNTQLHGYERSTHDLSFLWKSTMSAGTLVPFLNIVALPGDSIDIDLDAIVKTHPTIGPLFGSFKLQLDVFNCPIRLYNRSLHNNKLGIGMNMSAIKFPLITFTGDFIDENSEIPMNFQQINQSCIHAYLGQRGLGYDDIAEGKSGIQCHKLATPYIAYWDIFKNYYANKQEDNAYVIHGIAPATSSISSGGDNALPITLAAGNQLDITGTNITWDNVEIETNLTGVAKWGPAYKLAEYVTAYIVTVTEGKHLRITHIGPSWDTKVISGIRIRPGHILTDMVPTLESFPLSNLDDMRESLLAHNDVTAFAITENSPEPYGLPLTLIDLNNTGDQYMSACMYGQEGLAVKTYQSDIFNNWLQTDWITGANSISAITAISTAGNSFTIDTLNLSKKVYDMLNRIAVSGGSLEDWVEAVYDHNTRWRAETPIYLGGLSKEIIFQEVVSVAATAEEPLGSLAGKGIMSSKHKGGKIIINVDEPGFIMGIVSITPRISYSQGNEWHTNLKTLDDLHKPALDGIGFQDLITDQMAFWETNYNNEVPSFRSAGKQPAWLNYMTNYDKNYANFADPRTQQFMTLDRRYDIDSGAIKDLTTYIDPSKYNYAFAQVDLSAMNFWVQIANNITARRKISAKIIPNL